MEKAAENLLIRYKEFERRIKIAELSVTNRQAIVAAGMYTDPIQYLNEAVNIYSDLIQFNVEAESKSSISNLKSNAELFEEWKQLFGKIEENSSAKV